jgi:mannose-6-phosphate isomerase-like protein (cupin superfamily)
MPVFKSELNEAPAWCEMRFFEIVELHAGAKHSFERSYPREKLIVGEGRVQIAFDGKMMVADEGANLDLRETNSQFEVIETLSPATLIRMCGRWGEEVGGSGLFTVRKSDHLGDKGDPVAYPKETSFDSHYHDCDEYWIILQGRGVVVSEGKTYEVGPSDCLATRMGHHHDFPRVHEPVKGVYLETTLAGQKRHGHLWNHTHGPAQPAGDRV